MATRLELAPTPEQVLAKAMDDTRLALASLVTEEGERIVADQRLRKGPPPGDEPPAAGEDMPEASAAPPGTGAGEPTGADPGGDPAGGGGDPGGAPSIDEIKEWLSSQPPEVVGLIAQAIDEMGAGGGPGGDPGAGPGGPPEASHSPQPPPQEESAMKSEIAALRGQVATLQKNTEALQRRAAQPRPRAYGQDQATGLNKRETAQPAVTRITKAKVDEILLRKSQDPKTADADRTLINDFYFGRATVDKLSHMLKEAQ